MIEARGLSKHFQDKKRGEIRAVDNVSFRCEPGRIYGLLGANGAGKTTTLRILATIQRRTVGRFQDGGQNAQRRRLARPVRPQQSVNPPWLAPETHVIDRANLSALLVLEVFRQATRLDHQRPLAPDFPGLNSHPRQSLLRARRREYVSRNDRISSGMSRSQPAIHQIVMEPHLLSAWSGAALVSPASARQRSASIKGSSLRIGPISSASPAPVVTINYSGLFRARASKPRIYNGTHFV